MLKDGEFSKYENLSVKNLADGKIDVPLQCCTKVQHHITL